MVNQQERRVPITVVSLLKKSRGRIQIRIAETRMQITNATINGKRYEVANSLGRGRYVMKEADRD